MCIFGVAMLHIWTKDTCAPHMTYLSEGKRVILQPKQNPSSPVLFLVHSPLIVVPLAESPNWS